MLQVLMEGGYGGDYLSLARSQRSETVKALMGAIDNIIFEKAGSHGCSNSDYQLARTTCCDDWIVVDDELLTVFFNPQDLSKQSMEDELPECPLCGAGGWDYEQVEEWPKEPNPWQWAFHPDPGVVKAWQRR